MAQLPLNPAEVRTGQRTICLCCADVLASVSINQEARDQVLVVGEARVDRDHSPVSFERSLCQLEKATGLGVIEVMQDA